MRVLIVEDNPEAAQAIAGLVRRFGYETHVAHDGPQALKEAAENQPDVVLLDIGLPTMDGYEVARRLRDQAQDKRPLFIALTGHGNEQDRRLSTEAGIDLHLLKPADPRDVEAVLKRFEQIVLPRS
jgi:DNA-binding response OmpR family regulator